MIKVQHPNAEKLLNLINWHYESLVHTGRTGLKLHHVSHIVSIIFKYSHYSNGICGDVETKAYTTDGVFGDPPKSEYNKINYRYN
ncbi:MAG: hypothetical protein ABS24_09130 [SAR92 bacterium BACL26 MAG-121220-bin70]|jgi:hypothetical protein|uniref:Uncharacterized protein n=1 Tax=SAR92 bacterium BACL26 MAG-121220-bin70 TaxID=1655626 RepID=A0A0R2U0U0_9GAMM|nr:MAG: hypothetical protein ABS24_09130 [SAR92 bacterium BACL26 MAG-121220-bin70]